MFQIGWIAPMQGQANVFHRYFPERIPAAVRRYQNETRRLYEVLEARLIGRDYLRDEYSIADIANWASVRLWFWAGIGIEGLPNLNRWIERLAARPAGERGIEIPKRPKSAEDVVKSGRKIVQT
jgi:GST-like protein